MRAHLLVVVMLVSAICSATTYYISPQGSDSNDCLDPTPSHACLTPQHMNSLVHAGDTVNLRKGYYILTAPWVPTVSGTAGNLVTWQEYAPDVASGQAIITGATNPNSPLGTFTTFSTPPSTCVAPTCVDNFLALSAASFKNFEQLFYNDVRWEKPRTIHINAMPNTNTAPMCVAGANVGAGDTACGCPAGVLSRAAPNNHCAVASDPCAGGTPWRCNNLCMYSGSDVSASWRGVALGAVEIEVFEKWSMSRQRLLGASSGTMSFTGAAANSDNSGCLPGHDFIAENVQDVAVCGQWLLDRCPTNGACTTPEGTWNLHLYTCQGDNPNTALISLPQMDPASDNRLLVASGLSYNSFIGLSFTGDNWMPDSLGLPDSQSIPLVPAAISFTGSDHIVIDGIYEYHIQGWGIEFVGHSTNNTIQNSNLYDLGAGGIRIGLKATAGDLTSTVPSVNTIQYNKVYYHGRTQPTGEAVGIFLGNTFNNTVLHNTVVGGFSGGIDLGYGLDRGATGGTTAFLTYGNRVGYNIVQGYCIGPDCSAILVDFGGIYVADNCSANAPMCSGDPGTTPANFANEIDHNIVFDQASDYTNHQNGGAHGLYFDQGSSYNNIHDNVVFRTAADCLINSTPSHGQVNAAAQYVDQYNLWTNNIIGACGARQYAGSGVIDRRGDNLHSYKLTKNLVLYNSKLGNTAQIEPGHWACFDYSGGSPVATACTNTWFHDFNGWYDIAGGTPDFVICTTSNCQAGLTHYTAVPWGTGSPQQDVNSVTGASANPQFVNPYYPANDWTPQNTTLMTAVGFVTNDTLAQAGATTNTFPIPAAPNFFSQRSISAITDYLPALPSKVSGKVNVSGSAILK